MSPVLLEFRGYSIPSYGVLAALGILAAFLLAWRLARRVGVSVDFVLDAVFWTVLAGFLGARAGYLLISWRDAMRAPFAALFSGGGGVYLAGFLSGALALGIVSRRAGISLLLTADLFAAPLALGHAFGRVGCHLAGCCWGKPLAGVPTWLAVQYPRLRSAGGNLEGSWPYLDHLSRGWVSPAASCSLPVFPVQLVEAAYNLVLCGLLLVLWRKCPGRGIVAGSYLAAYGVGRFLVEFFRGDSERGYFGALSSSQWISLALLAVGAAVLFRAVRSRAG